MIDMNDTKLTGNLVADLTPRTFTSTETGEEFTSTWGRIVRTNSYRKNGEWTKSELMGFDFEVRGKSGENLAAKAHKGTAILIEGEWVPNIYDKEDGTKVFGVRLRVHRWQVIAQPGERRAVRSEPQAPAKTRRSRKAAVAVTA